MDDRYPIGGLEARDDLSLAELQAKADEIAAAPASLRGAVDGLSTDQLGTPYRADAWTVRQIVHHVADSHLNGYVRSKLAMTEDGPEASRWDATRWATLDDAATAEVSVSLGLLDALHQRWVGFLRSLSFADFQRTVHYPEMARPVSIAFLVQLHVWHGAHHAAQITDLRVRCGW